MAVTSVKRTADTTGDDIAVYLVDGKDYQAVVPCASDGTPQTQPLTDTQIRAAALPVSLPTTPTANLATIAGMSKAAGVTDATTLRVITASDGPLNTNIAALIALIPKIPTTFKTLKAVAVGSIATAWTPASGKKVRLMGGCISLSVAASVLFEDNSVGTDVYQSPALLALTPYNFDLGDGVLSAAANNVLKATSSAAATITGTLYGREE